MKVEEAAIPGFGGAERPLQRFPKVVTYSSFRNCESFVPEFFARRDRLTYPKDRLQHILVEGDSEDDTYTRLRAEVARRPGVALHKADFYGPQIKGFIHPGRCRKFAMNANYAIETLLRDSDAEYVLWIESDLDYPPDLIERFLRTEKDFVAPVVFLRGTKDFYDTFAYRKGSDPRFKGPTNEPGCFQAKPPYHPAYRPDQLFEVDSAGSCLFFKMDVLRAGAYFPETDLIVGFCRTARERGFPIWVDPKTEVLHPESDSVLDWSMFVPWHETKNLMKYQETVPVDTVAFELGRPYEFASASEFGWVAKRLSRRPGTPTLHVGEASTLPAYCAKLGMNVFAAGSAESLSQHREIVQSSGVNYRFSETQGCKLPFADEQFTQVVALNWISFQQEDSQAARELQRVCKKGGRIVLTLFYDHLIYWWDHCNGQAPGRHYYDIQAVFDRIVRPMQSEIRDITFIRYELPKLQKDPIFTHPNNAGMIALELERIS